MVQEYSFSHAGHGSERGDWSGWYDLDEGHVFDPLGSYRFRDKPEAPIVDGIYIQLDTVGCVKGKAYSRYEGDWYAGYVHEPSGSASNEGVYDDEMSDDIARRDGYVRLVVADA